MKELTTVDARSREGRPGQLRGRQHLPGLDCRKPRDGLLQGVLKVQAVGHQAHCLVPAAMEWLKIAY